MYADHSPQNTVAAMMQAHIRLVFLFGRQIDRSFDVLRHRNGTYTLTMLTDEGLPGGLILRPLADGELWNNFDIGFRLVSDDDERQDMGLWGVNENNNDVNDGANRSANENNNDENVNVDNNHDEHNDENNEGNDDDNGENENEQNSSNDDGGTGDGVIDLTYSNDSTNSANENNEDENENDINNHDEHKNENNGGNDEDDGENENEENSNADGGTTNHGDGVIDLTYSTDEDEWGVDENHDDDGTNENNNEDDRNDDNNHDENEIANNELNYQIRIVI